MNLDILRISINDALVEMYLGTYESNLSDILYVSSKSRKNFESLYPISSTLQCKTALNSKVFRGLELICLIFACRHPYTNMERWKVQSLLNLLIMSTSEVLHPRMSFYNLLFRRRDSEFENLTSQQYLKGLNLKLTHQD